MQRSNATAAKSAPLPQDALTLLESSSVFGCVVVAPDGRIRWLNTLFRRWLKSTASCGGQTGSLFDWLANEDDRAALNRALSSDANAQLHIRLGSNQGPTRRLAGDLVPLSGRGKRPLYAGIFHEVAAEAQSGGDVDRKLKAGWERSARLEALGSLTSGVAHDFNNLLTILVGNLSLVAEELRHEPRQFAKLKAARDAARRGGELIKQLLSFARQEPVASDRINPSKVITRIAPLVQRALGTRIKFELDLDEQVEPIHGNSAQLESVIVNLAVNARDAIENQGKVTVRVSTSGAVAASKQHSLGQSKNLVIEVIDDGAGIPAEVVARVFDPFFTTKGEGKGSGLGLSMVKQYAEQFGGTAAVNSEPGVGTTVRLSFPTAPGTVNDSSALTMPLAALPSGNESIIVLARDENMSAMIDQILTVLGYQIRVAGDLRRVSELLRDAVPNLVICDGFEIRPLLEAHATSSDNGRVLMLQANGADRVHEGDPVLHKPFSIPDLALSVREALDAK